jgi:hypothetical protein
VEKHRRTLRVSPHLSLTNGSSLGTGIALEWKTILQSPLMKGIFDGATMDESMSFLVAAKYKLPANLQYLVSAVETLGSSPTFLDIAAIDMVTRFSISYWSTPCPLTDRTSC